MLNLYFQGSDQLDQRAACRRANRQKAARKGQCRQDRSQLEVRRQVHGCLASRRKVNISPNVLVYLLFNRTQTILYNFAACVYFSIVMRSVCDDAALGFFDP